MMFRRLLLCALFLGLIVGMGNANVIGYHYMIPKTTVAPTIDGLVDSVWKTVDWNFQRSYDNGPVPPVSYVDLTGIHKMMWDDEFLYAIFFSQDSIVWDVHQNSWERDGVEFYCDPEYTRLHSVVAPCQHITFQHRFIGNEAVCVDSLGFSAGLDKTGTEFAIFDEESTMEGYWVEFKIPMSVLGITAEAGQQIGLEWQQNDNDGANRESVSKWWLDRGDSSYQYSTTWGTAVLSDRVASNSLEIMKLPTGTVPVIDGEMDQAYHYANPVSQNRWGNGSTYPRDLFDIFATSYLLWDDENLYLFTNINDDIIVDAHQNSWERDGFEFYCDPTNSKAHSVVAPSQHITFQHRFIGNEAVCVDSLGFSAGLDKTGTEFSIVDTELGWALEFKIPMAVLGVTAEVGQDIGLELQENDNDGLNRESITKWWLDGGDSSYQYSTTWGTAFLGSELTVGVKPEPKLVADYYSLAQNYPNPFNPTTSIPYTLKNRSHVRLTVYDITGREVGVLVNGFQTAGTHQVTFNASSLSSGIYFYKLQAADNVFTKKMMVLK